MPCCRGQLAQQALGFIVFLSFHTEFLTTNWLPVELLKPENVDAKAPKCSCGAERCCVQTRCSFSTRVPKASCAGLAALIPKSSIDQRLKPSKNHISLRLQDESFVLPVSNLLGGQMKVHLLEAQPQSSSGHLATKRVHGPLSGREP